jgi:nuclear polyadenylated RNA-binding protein 3
MTSTYTASSTDALSTTATPANNLPTNADTNADADHDTSDASSFSDPYDEQDAPEHSDSAAPGAQAEVEIDDDYAMTFESDSEMASNSPEEVSSEVVDQHEVIHSAPAPLPGSEIAPSSLAANPSIINTTTGHIDTSSLNPTTPLPTTSSEPAPLAADGNVAPAMVETTQAQSQPPPTHSYESIAKGEIDIQQLLDNITANAEIDASANGTPTTATTSSPTFPPGPSTLPSHSSLPPRPQVLQKPAMHPAYASQDDIRRYHAGPSYAVPPGATSYRAPGMPMPIVASGAPGTKTDVRNILPPPPSASFNAPPSLPAPPSAVLPPHPKDQRVSAQDRLQTSIETGDAEDAGEIQWSPDVQKVYDKFLADERMYVSEGLWDRFPAGSRLFIGMICDPYLQRLTDKV